MQQRELPVLPSTYIVYACPLGPLAVQLEAYFAAARARCGPNTAHRYMPHCTLTGFFRDDSERLPAYIAAMHAALNAAFERPLHPVGVYGMQLSHTFHGLLIDAPWLQSVIAGFAARAGSPAHDRPLRLKANLHLSLAYDFPPEQHDPLAALARELVDPHASATWEVRLYERHNDWSWTCHAAWPI